MSAVVIHPAPQQKQLPQVQLHVLVWLPAHVVRRMMSSLARCIQKKKIGVDASETQKQTQKADRHRQNKTIAS